MTSKLQVTMIEDYDDSVKSIYLNILGAISIHEEKKEAKIFRYSEYVAILS